MIGNTHEIVERLSKAAIIGDFERVKKLVEVKEGVDPSHLRQPFFCACEGGYADIADYLLAAGAREPSLTLHQAIQSNSVRVCESVSPQELFKINLVNRDGFTPLEVAAKKSNDVLRFILSVKDLEVHSTQNRLSYLVKTTPLIAAVRGGLAANVKTLIDHKCDVNEANKFGETALHAAASNGAHNLIPILMAGGADINLQGSYGHTALMKVKRGDVPTLEALLSYPACDVNVVDMENRQAIVLQARGVWSPDVARCCSLLLDRMRSTETWNANTLMTTAIYRQCEPLIGILLDRGCPPHVEEDPSLLAKLIGSESVGLMRDKNNFSTIFAFLATRNRPEDQELLSLFIEKGVAESEPAEACLFCIRGAIFQTNKTFALCDLKDLLAKHRTALELRIDGIRVIDRLLMNTLQDSRRVELADIVSDLCDFGADVNLSLANVNISVLGVYLQRGDVHPEIIAVLIGKSLNLRIASKSSSEEYFASALHAYRPDICMVLIEFGLDVDAFPMAQLTIAMGTYIAVNTESPKESYLALARRVLSASADLRLRYGLGKDCPTMVRLLLEYGSSVNAMPVELVEEGEVVEEDCEGPMIPLNRLCDMAGYTTFVHRQRLRIIKAALDAGMDVDGGSDSNELTPLMVAANRRWYELAWLLMANGADTTRTHNGVTAYELVVNHPQQTPNSRRIAKLLAPHLCMDDVTTGAPETDDEENEVGETYTRFRQ